VELAEQLHRVLAVLEPVTAALWDLVRDGYEANWLCYVPSHVGTGPASIMGASSPAGAGRRRAPPSREERVSVSDRAGGGGGSRVFWPVLGAFWTHDSRGR